MRPLRSLPALGNPIGRGSHAYYVVLAALETEQQYRQPCRRSEQRVGCCLLPVVSVTESPGTGHRPAPPPCCAPPMPDWFWSLWQTIKYPPRSTDPPCVFVQDPALDVPLGLYQDCAAIPPKTGRSSRVVFISDTHGRHDTVRVPPGDVLCHCGDIMMMGGKFSRLFCQAQYAAFDAWMVPCPSLASFPLAKPCKIHDAEAPAPFIPVMLFQARQPCTHKIVIAGNHDQHLQVSTSNNQFPRTWCTP